MYYYICVRARGLWRVKCFFFLKAPVSPDARIYIYPCGLGGTWGRTGFDGTRTHVSDAGCCRFIYELIHYGRHDAIAQRQMIPVRRRCRRAAGTLSRRRGVAAFARDNPRISTVIMWRNQNATRYLVYRWLRWHSRQTAKSAGEEVHCCRVSAREILFLLYCTSYWWSPGRISEWSATARNVLAAISTYRYWRITSRKLFSLFSAKTITMIGSRKK